ncbi:MAG: YeeE/YedE thiosulfate transporter family protein, partial [Thermoprotei archaeon]
SPLAVAATALMVGAPFMAFGLYLQRKTRKRFESAASYINGRPNGVHAATTEQVGKSSVRPSLRQRAWRMVTLKESFGTNLATVLLFLDLLLVFLVGSGYTFNYLVITSSDGGRFLEYLLMPFHVNLALNTPWYNSSLPIVDTSVLMVVMLIIGAFSASYLSGDFKIRVPRERKRLGVGFGGGILVGIGVRMALGCNIGLMWTNFAQLGYDGMLFLPSMLAGVALAVKVQELFL